MRTQNLRLSYPLISLFLALALPACTEGASEQRRGTIPTARFEDLFEEVARIEFEEPFREVLTRINKIGIAPDGRIVIADPGSGKVRVYSPTGRLLRSLGRNGDGPGEFRSPTDAAFAEDGSLFVINFAPPRVTRFTPELELDTVFRIPDTEGLQDVYAVGDTLLFHMLRRIPRAYKYEWYNRDGEKLGRFHREHMLVSEVPYWRNATNEIATISGDEIFVANQIMYPIYRYTREGVLADSFGIPPVSWVQGSKLRRGQFSRPGDRRTFEQWMRTFTSMAELVVYRDSLLLVSHERFNPEELSYREGIYTLDIYTLDLRKLYEDVPLAGEMMAKSRDYMYLLLATPPAPWTLGKYRLRSDVVR